MRPDNWLAKFWSRFYAGVVQDVPPTMEECEACREVDCTNERWQTCERRLAAESARLAATGTGTGRTNEELPGMSDGPRLPAASEEHLPASEQPRTKKISTH